MQCLVVQGSTKEIKRQAKEQAASNPAVDSSSHMSELLPSILKLDLFMV